MMLVVGTSCEMMPAAELPHIARQHGALIVEINRENTTLSPYVTHT
ncbi:MAG: RNA polymerase subunit sigma, partial [Thermoplasmata archaeon]